MNVTLRPNRDLLDPTFESYKLSLEKIPVSACSISNPVYYRPPESSLSKQHIQSFSQHNCLFADPFFPGDVYYVDIHGSICWARIPEDTASFNVGIPVYTFPKWKECDDRGQPTLTFPSASLAVACDGNGLLVILQTQRSSTGSIGWTAVFHHDLPQGVGSLCLLDAVCPPGSDDLNCIFASIAERPINLSLKTKSSYVTYLDWFTYCSGEPAKWALSRQRRFVGSSFPDYVSLTCDSMALHICSENSFIPIADSLDGSVADRASEQFDETTRHLKASRVSLMSTTSDEVPSDLSSTTPSIQWSQSDPSDVNESGGIHISFELDFALSSIGQKIDPNAVQIQISPSEISDDANVQMLKVIATRADAGALNSAASSRCIVLFDHSLYGFVEPKSIWHLDVQSNCLEVHLSKLHDINWPRLLRDGEQDRKLVKSKDAHLSASEIEQVQEGPQTSETTNVTPKSSFNVEQLEDVDFPLDDSEDDLVLQRFDVNGLKLTHQASLSGHQWLFNVLVNRVDQWPSTKALCLRHDVDGIVWLPDHSSDSVQWIHAATLQAFGYVLASKRDHRFVCSPGIMPHNQQLSFVAVADASKRIYVYRQPVDNSLFPDGDTQLRHRSTENGNKTDRIVRVAWQHVITLPSDEPIVGFSAFEKPRPCCVVCTQTTLYLLSLIG